MKISTYALVTAFLLFAFLNTIVFAQSERNIEQDALFIDEKGILRWQNNDSEAAFFGVNYSTPFAFAYRAHQTLGVDIEEAIRQDVYHMARLGFDAFRVHVWDTEISDIEGNLLENEHLRLFDFLLSELKKRNIKTIITPIAFWGNGYPEPDEDTPGFSNYYGRGRLTTDEAAISAQENYLKQFFKHVNPYTGMSYQEDHDVVAVEINNEPAHSGPKEGVTEYINRLKQAITSTGFSKPIFYNISQGPNYADAVAKSDADGFSFQWYPSGLVSGKTLNENFLPHVNRYAIPFDTIPEFQNKPLMVYEFDAADILEPYMYPAMARSFRQAGFQWATQFAYDPLAIANTNTEYQTHYLNLAYTPAKAISMMIAAKAFHRLPLREGYGDYPANNQFGPFRVSYELALSEMNTDEEFYYSNHTRTQPKNPTKLRHVAGVGNSFVVSYEGFGAYFLDKLAEGVWRLEVMPDAVHIRDPFAKTSPDKSVTRIHWEDHSMKINLEQLGTEFKVLPLNEGNSFETVAEKGHFRIRPGSYLLQQKDSGFKIGDRKIGTLGLREYIAPMPEYKTIALYHRPSFETSSQKPLKIYAKISGIEHGKATLQYNQRGGRYINLPLNPVSKYDFEAEIPTDAMTPGNLRYRIVIEKDGETLFYPGEEKLSEIHWASDPAEFWEVFVARKDGSLKIFSPGEDIRIQIYPSYDPGFSTGLIAGYSSGEFLLQMKAEKPETLDLMGFQFPIKEKLSGRINEVGDFRKMVIRARVVGRKSLPISVGLTDVHAGARTALINLSDTFEDVEIDLNDLQANQALLLPRPYPGFMPLTIPVSESKKVADLEQVEKIQISFGSSITGDSFNKPYQVEIGAVWLK